MFVFDLERREEVIHEGADHNQIEVVVVEVEIGVVGVDIVDDGFTFNLLGLDPLLNLNFTTQILGLGSSDVFRLSFASNEPTIGVPEPGTLVLLLGGLMVLGVRARLTTATVVLESDGAIFRRLWIITRKSLSESGMPVRVVRVSA